MYNDPVSLFHVIQQVIYFFQKYLFIIEVFEVKPSEEQPIRESDISSWDMTEAKTYFQLSLVHYLSRSATTTYEKIILALSGEAARWIRRLCGLSWCVSFQLQEAESCLGN